MSYGAKQINGQLLIYHDFFRECVSCTEFSLGPFLHCYSLAVDQEIEYGHNNGIRYRQHCPLVHGADLCWLQVHECCRYKGDSNKQDVRIQMLESLDLPSVV